MRGLTALHDEIDEKPVFRRFTGFIDFSGKNAGGYHIIINDSASNEGSYSGLG